MTTNVSDFLQNIGLLDDTEVAVDAKTYVGQSNPAPAKPGIFGFKVKSLDFAKDKEGNPRVVVGTNARGKEVSYPVLCLEQAQIVEPDENKRLVMLYQNYSTKPFQRMAGKNASQAGDLFRGFTTDRSGTTAEVIEALINEYGKDGSIFYAELDWQANDWGWVADQIEEQNLSRDNEEDRKKINELYVQAKQVGWYKFRDEKGNVSHLWEGPSGAVIEAKAYLKKIFPANKPPKTLGVAKGFEPF